MEAAIDRIMQTYGMIVRLTPDKNASVRRQVTRFLGRTSETDERKLAINGLRYVRELKIGES